MEIVGGALETKKILSINTFNLMNFQFKVFLSFEI